MRVVQVVDASVVVEALRPDRPLSQQSAEVLKTDPIAPELVDLEVIHTIRRLRRMGDIDDIEGHLVVRDLMRMPLVRRSHRPFLPRIWDLRDNLTAYDAAYVALAEALGCPLVTADTRLAGAAGVRCEIVVLGD